MLATLAVWAWMGCAENSRTSAGPPGVDAAATAAEDAMAEGSRREPDADLPPDASAADSALDSEPAPSDAADGGEAGVDAEPGMDADPDADGDAGTGDPCEPNPC